MTMTKNFIPTWHKLYKTDSFTGLRPLPTKTSIDKDFDFSSYTSNKKHKTTSWSKNLTWDVPEKNGVRELFLRIVQFPDISTLEEKTTKKTSHPVEGITASSKEISPFLPSALSDIYVPITKIFYCQNGPGENHRTRFYLDASKKSTKEWISIYKESNDQNPGPVLYKNGKNNFWFHVIPAEFIPEKNEEEKSLLHSDICVAINREYEEITKYLLNIIEDSKEITNVKNKLQSWVKAGYKVGKSIPDLENQEKEYEAKIEEVMKMTREHLEILNKRDLAVLSNETDYTDAITNVFNESTISVRMENMKSLMRDILQNLQEDMDLIEDSKFVLNDLYNKGVNIGNAQTSVSNQLDTHKLALQSVMTDVSKLKNIVAKDSKIIS